MSGLLFVSYSGLLGGAERFLLDCAAGLAEPAVLACPPGRLANAARDAGVTVLELPPRSLRLRSGPRARVRATAALAAHRREVQGLARRLDPDLTVAWGMRSALAALPGSAGRPVAVVHNDFLPGPVIGAAVRAAVRRAATVIVPSRAVAGDLDPRGRLGDRLRVVTPGVDPGRYAGAADAGGPANPPEVLVLGALTGWKRPDLALEIVARARRRIPELRLRLVGAPLTGDDCLLEEALRRRAARPDLAGAVELAGSRADPRADLERAACLLHCAPREPFGIVLLEALAAGRPVVAPDAAGPREIVDPACGRLYRPGGADAGAGALVELLGDPPRALAAGLAGRELIARRFTRARSQAAFADAVDPVLARRRRERPTPRRLDARRLTLVTVTRNSAAELELLLASVARHLPGSATIVVDCASTDDSVGVARERPEVAVVALGENLGFGRAGNRGLARVQTPVTALVNPDVELLDDSLLGLAAEAMRADRPPRLLAPRVLSRDGRLQDTVHPLPGSPAGLIAALVPPAALPGRPGAALAPWRSTRPRRVGWAVGCALVAQTATLRDLGPFSESLFLYGEDLELGLHARRRGVQTWLWPAATVVHRRAHSTVQEFGGEAFERLARGRHAAIALRRGPGAALLDDATQALTFASRLALKRALGRPAARERRQLQAIGALRRAVPPVPPAPPGP